MPSLDPTLHWIISIGVVLLFASATVQKLRDWPRFVAALRNYRVLPESLAPAGAAALLALELAVVGLFLVAPLRAVGAVLAAALLLLYAIAIAMNLARGRASIDCGCVGFAHRTPISRWMVWRNLGLAAVTLLVALPRGTRVSEELDYVTIASAVLSLVALYATQGVLGRTARSPARQA